MKEVYAVHEGARIQIGAHGVATKHVPALVPDDVAAGLVERVDAKTTRARSDLRIVEPGRRTHTPVVAPRPKPQDEKPEKAETTKGKE